MKTILTAQVTIFGAYDVARFLERMIPEHAPLRNVKDWELVRDALYALSNDTDAMVTDSRRYCVTETLQLKGDAS